jgi:DNA-binding transcriptional ArsR family regulator
MAGRTGKAKETADGGPGAGASFAPPEPERLVSDVETLKALSDPLRLRILETMVTDAGSAWSVKELAAALEVPQTRLYHHIDMLVERDLLRAAEQRVVSGIIETRYRLAALSLRLDPQLVRGGGAGESAAREMLTAVFDETRRDVVRLLADPNLGDEASLDRPLVSRGVARLTPEQARELRARLVAIVEEYDGPTDDPGARTYRTLIAMYADPASGDPSRG